MRFTVLTAATLLGLTLALPNAVSIEKRDKVGTCKSLGEICTTPEQEVCDPETDQLSICHKWDDKCWIRYTNKDCPVSKRSPDTKEIQKRDRFAECSTFGANCLVDGNTFCMDGRKSRCHHVPFTTSCWVRYESDSC